MPKRMLDCHRLMEVSSPEDKLCHRQSFPISSGIHTDVFPYLQTTFRRLGSPTDITDADIERRRELFKGRRKARRKNSINTAKLGTKRSKVRGTIIHKAMEAKRLVERTKSLKHGSRNAAHDSKIAA